MSLLTKTELMSYVSVGRCHECFEHSIEGVFDVTEMRYWAQKHLEAVPIAIEDIASHLRTSRVYEQARVDELSESSARDDPALVVVQIRGGVTEHLYIDGTHRALKLEGMGVATQLAYLIPEKNIIRPAEGLARNSDFDWGDEFRDGEIIKRGVR